MIRTDVVPAFFDARGHRVNESKKTTPKNMLSVSHSTRGASSSRSCIRALNEPKSELVQSSCKAAMQSRSSGIRDDMRLRLRDFLPLQYLEISANVSLTGQD